MIGFIYHYSKGYYFGWREALSNSTIEQEYYSGKQFDEFCKMIPGFFFPILGEVIDAVDGADALTDLADSDAAETLEKASQTRPPRE